VFDVSVASWQGYMRIAGLAVRVIFAGAYALAQAAIAQTVDFNNNRNFPTPADRRVYDGWGQPVVGTNYLARLLYGWDASNLQPTGGAVRFRNVSPNDPTAGTWSGGMRTLTGFFAGDTVTLAVQVWEVHSAVRWQSAPFSYRIPPQGALPTNYYIENFRAFGPLSPPMDRVLSIRPNVDGMELLYIGTHTIQGAESLSGPWITLYTGTAPYTDPASATNSQRFYRWQDQPGPIYSLNAVGYYEVNACAGFMMIANQLNSPFGSTVETVLRSAREGTAIYKYNPSTGGYISLSYLGGAWEGDDLLMSLRPGEGAFLHSPVAQSRRIVGEVSSFGSVAIPSGFSIISAPTPRTGPLNQMGFPTAEGICIFQWACGATGYRANCYIGGAWEGDDSGNAPSIAPGESFWVQNPGPALSWNVTQCLTCP
jgi:hypothetical protein